ncbi:MAG: hypothetical protein KJ666_03585 [Bacteroidetes bacterium]|nr:hypothetical protein [Bacteroidota bacterium]
MAELLLNNTTLDKYFGILNNLDIDSKKKLIVKLTESIHPKEKEHIKLEDIYGAWQDSRTAEEIINEIEFFRSDNRDIEEF